MSRIVTLLARASEIVYAQAVLDSAAFRCGWEAPIENDLRVKSFLVYEILDDILEQMQPACVLTQTQCDVCAVSPRGVEASVAGRLESRSADCVAAARFA